MKYEEGPSRTIVTLANVASAANELTMAFVPNEGEEFTMSVHTLSARHGTDRQVQIPSKLS